MQGIDKLNKLGTIGVTGLYDPLWEAGREALAKEVLSLVPELEAEIATLNKSAFDSGYIAGADKTFATLTEKMACGHPKACEGIIFYGRGPNDPPGNRLGCTACAEVEAALRKAAALVHCEPIPLPVRGEEVSWEGIVSIGGPTTEEQILALIPLGNHLDHALREARRKSITPEIMKQFLLGHFTPYDHDWGNVAKQFRELLDPAPGGEK